MRNVIVFAWVLALAGLVPAGADAASRARRSAPAVTPVPWIHDDYPRAVALARARKVPIFVEAWAPW